MYFIKNNKAYLLLHTEITQDLAEEANSFIYGLEFYDEVEELVVSINSGGGSVVAGFSIFNALRNSSKRVKTINEFLAGSMAGIIFLAGEEREMADVALFMLHNPSGGNDKILSKIKDSLMIVLGRDFKENLVEWMDNETWLNASEMQQLGLVKVIDTQLEKTLDLQNSSVQEIAEIVNKGVLKNKYINLQSDMENMENKELNTETEEIVNEEHVEESASVEETNESKTEEPKAEEVNEPSEMDLLKETIERLNKKVDELSTEKEELQRELTNYKEVEIKEGKLELLNSSSIDKADFDKWLDLDLNTLKNLVPTIMVSKSAPEVEIKNETDLDLNKMTIQERKDLLNSNPQLYLELNKKRK